MKSLLIFSLFLLPSLSFATKKEKTKIAEMKVTAMEVKKNPEVPCKETAEEVMKKLEEKKKEEAQKGLGLSLQGAKSGCSVK